MTLNSISSVHIVKSHCVVLPQSAGLFVILLCFTKYRVTTCLDIMEELDNSGVGITLDVGKFTVDMENVVEMLGAVLVHVRENGVF